MALKIQRFIEFLVLLLVFILTSLRSFILWDLFPATLRFSDPAWREILVWLFLLLFIGYLIYKQNLWRDYFLSWKSQPFLIVFLLYAIISTLWSITWTGTLYRSLGLLFTTLAAAYLSWRYSLEEFMEILSWVGILFISASLYLVIMYPGVGTDINPPFNGAWRGIFWHKNHLGNIIPLFNMIFLVQIFQPGTHFCSFKKIIAVVFYLLALVLVYQAESASGYILTLIVHFGFLVFAMWVRIHARLKPAHYWVALALLLVGVTFIASNLDFIFGLFNRGTTLTGRVPLWQYLIEQVYSKKPVFGYGFGSLWTLESFRLSTQAVVGWGYPVMIGDNGFIDILLNGGIFGLILFLVVYTRTWIASFRYSITRRTVASAFPFIFVIYTFFVNLSFSMFLETESFIWLICIFLLFTPFSRISVGKN